jgi:hypothetical protein
MSEGLIILLLYGSLLYIVGGVAWLVYALPEDRLLAPVWPLFWLKFVWRRLRQ